MSHVVSIAVEIGTDADSLAAVRQACKEMGLIFKEGQKSYKWWGYSVGDSPLPAGFTAEDLGKCDHAIGIPGTDWEVGLSRPGNGKGYRLLFDYYGSEGRPILAGLGVELDGKGNVKKSKFTQMYGVAKAEVTARKLGHAVTRQVLKNGSINVLISGGRY